MNSVGALRTDCVYATLEDRQNAELRFRSAMITSTALHTGVALLILLAPFLIPKPVLFEFTSVNLVELTPRPDPVPPPADTQAENPASSEPEEPPTPEEIEPLPPEDVPEDLEAQRRQEEEDEARRREEEKRRQEELETQRRTAEEAARRRQQEEERRRLEEEEARRRAPQKATREEATPAEEPAGSPLEVSQRDAGIHARLPRSIRQQPGGTGSADDEAEAEDLRHIPHTAGGRDILCGPQLHLHDAETGTCRPRRHSRRCLARQALHACRSHA